MLQHSPIIWQWLLALVGIAANAAAALPIIIILGIAVGRRGNAAFCIQGTLALFRIALLLSPLGIIFFIGNWLAQIHDFAAIPYLIFRAASLPYISSAAMWFLGICFLYLSYILLKAKIPSADTYRLSQLKKPLFCCILAACCYFSTYFLINWPFAGLPEGLPLDRAVMAILRNGARHYFYAFCPAGAIALLFALHWQKALAASQQQIDNGIRWLSVWAAIGYLPYLLQRGGVTLGIWLRGNAGFTASFPGFWAQVCSLCLLTLAIACWIWLFVAKNKNAALAWLGAGLLFARESVPYMAKLFQI